MNNTWYPRDRRNTRYQEDPIRDTIVSNERIRHPQVRLIDDMGEQCGIMPIKQALWMAYDKGMDLIEIAADANPPVVRIVNIDKWVYNLKKAKKEQDKKARENATVIKEIQLRPVTDKHDLMVKQEHAKAFLEDNAKVKIVIKFKGRELGFTDKGFEIMNQFITGLEPCKIEKSPELAGRVLSAIVAPGLKKV